MPNNRVKVSLSYKVNMGNFETLGIEYGLEADTLDGETTKQAFDRIEEFVSDKLFNEVKRIKEDL